MIGSRRLLSFPLLLVTIALWLCNSCQSQNDAIPKITASAKPWVFWYWMSASVSREGITADLEAMKEAGIGGAYLMPIKGPAEPPLMTPPINQLSPEWWEMVKHAMNEADRLGLKIAMHASDGFALAGGPWITPELSMQKVVWTETHVDGGINIDTLLQQPETNEGYYEDIAVLAFPSLPGTGQNTGTVIPHVTTSIPNVSAQMLVTPGNQESFKSEEPCWIQYTFDKPFTCRTITIRTKGNNYQAHRLIIQTSNDGRNFQTVTRLQPPRHGWQDTDADVTHVINPVTAQYFRFVYDKEGSEPGAEDLDAAKWKPVLKVCGIELSSAPHINQFEGKTGEVWRISTRTTAEQVPDTLCLNKDSIIDITEHMKAGRLTWHIPPGRWTILRMGHTSTGHTNYTGGAGKGLECDKFNPQAITLQFDRWFGEAVKQAGPALASRVMSIFHVDSWECGSQNWSPVFRAEFKKRRGYDLFAYLPAMAGIPVQSADVSERFLHDIRQTIAELVVDNFYGIMAKMAHKNGTAFSAESVAPTMTSDGLLHYGSVDVPMGEFWLNSPTHDKFNDMLDAVSGAHIYGKPLIQAEAFTTVRMAWDEYPGMLKAVGDRNYALGVNRFVYHVFAHNPWMDRKPGMTLDGVGLYMQRDQTWWKPGKEWVTYAQRCQQLLQQGRPVVDVAVFTGEETPRRALLPEKLVSTLPGIFGADVVEREAARVANAGVPMREMPAGVTHTANTTTPQDWPDPLRGYKYDSFNKDVLLRLAKVNNGRIELPGGASYGVLVIPASPDNTMTPAVAKRLLELVKEGATIMIAGVPDHSPSLEKYPACDAQLKQVTDELLGGTFDTGANHISMKKLGKGSVVHCPYQAPTLEALGIARDVIATDEQGKPAAGITWTHRKKDDRDIYFISNQQDTTRIINLSLRVSGRTPILYDAVTNEACEAGTWKSSEGHTTLPVRLEPNASLFVTFMNTTSEQERNTGKNWHEITAASTLTLNNAWKVTFDPAFGGPKQPVEFESLTDWSKNTNESIRYYSGTAIYTYKFTWKDENAARVWLDLGQVANIAEVTLNGKPCGILWTRPYRLGITNLLQEEENQLTIAVTNTWANRLIGDHALPEAQRITNTTAPFRLEGKPLLEAGLLGPVKIIKETN